MRRIKPSKDGAPPPARAINPIPGERAIPGLEDADLTMKVSAIRAEGTFLSRQRGSIVAIPSGESAFVFHADERGLRERPMVLLPCQTLQRMQKLVSERGDRTALLVSGQVFTYLDLNYMLPTAYSVAGEAAQERPAARPSGDDGQERSAGGASGDPELADLIRSLEAQRARPAALERRANPSERSSTAEAREGAGTSLAEGGPLNRRRGRMVRDSAGRWVFTFDSGPKGEAGTDAPLTLMPCQTLQRMEAWATRWGDGVTFTVSGSVYQHQGKGYLMPSAFLVNRSGDVGPRQ